MQKNATAIRLTYLPTGMIVTCQNERSQMQNRENAFRVLRGRLAAIREEEQEKQLAELRGEYKKAEWGNQIRSYVLHPYQMVKDHRTDHEVGSTQAVLDGEINEFIESYLRSGNNRSAPNFKTDPRDRRRDRQTQVIADSNRVKAEPNIA